MEAAAGGQDDVVDEHHLDVRIGEYSLVAVGHDRRHALVGQVAERDDRHDHRADGGGEGPAHRRRSGDARSKSMPRSWSLGADRRGDAAEDGDGRDPLASAGTAARRPTSGNWRRPQVCREITARPPRWDRRTRRTPGACHRGGAKRLRRGVSHSRGTADGWRQGLLGLIVRHDSLSLRWQLKASGPRPVCCPPHSTVSFSDVM